MKRLTIAALVVSSALGSIAAEAQDSGLLVGGGAGVVNPLHGDLQFTAPAWHLSLRANAGRLVSFEVTYNEWRRIDEDVRTNVPTYGPSGATGTIGRLAQRTERVTRTAGINVLLSGTFGRATVWGGGGPAYMDFAREYRQQLSDCRGTPACNDFSSSHRAGAFAAQLAAGLDVRLARRLFVYGQYAFAAPIDDPGSGELSLSAGVRFKVW